MPQSGGDQFQYDTEDQVFCGILKTPLPDINFVPTPSNIIIDLEKNNDAFMLRSNKANQDCCLVIKNLELRVLNYTLNEVSPYRSRYRLFMRLILFLAF